MKQWVLWCLTSKTDAKIQISFESCKLRAEKITLFLISFISLFAVEWANIVCPDVNELLAEVVCKLL